ncbi:MAG TPA: HAMP domain-containing sensor histidine kinase [Gaiellaceae bacterium]|nr:HAMP domain-containing sensor histidine kinase [Gaiellaceae bacterium]
MKRPGQWIALVRLALVVVAIADASVTDFAPGYRAWAWFVIGFFGASAVCSAWLARVELSRASRVRARVAAIVLDAISVVGFIAVFSYQPAQPYRALYLLPILEAALRFGLVGGFVGAVAMGVALGVVDVLGPGTQVRSTIVRVVVGLFAGVIVGRLSDDLRDEKRAAQARAAEAEKLRDALGRRVDLLEAANRCSRALASSLDLEEAFGAFIRELRGLVPFDRCAIVLAERGVARIMATAGEGAQAVFPPGSEWPLSDSVTADVLEGATVVQRDLGEESKSDVSPLLALGLHSRLAAPLLAGPRAIGMLSLSRRDRDAFGPDELELASLLGRLVGSAVQNIRVFEAERRTVEELRRVYALRADFVSLVSHELRSPMAAVIGAANTLHGRWRELSSEHRDAFLALIADETSRLSSLISDVLDTSRIEAGTFTFSFSDVDVAVLVADSVAAAAAVQDEVAVVADLDGPLPAVRGDRERLRQVLANLIDNGVKYSDAGSSVVVSARRAAVAVRIEVCDHGPGIASEQHSLIFEKFGRAKGNRPGTGLGLFIARSIAEAHGGTLEVRSELGLGATFVLELPV